MPQLIRFLTFTLSGFMFLGVTWAQTSLTVGAGQVLLAPRSADNAPPQAIGLTDRMKGQAVATNQWYSGLIFSRQPEVLFAQPYSVRAASTGFEIALPTRQVIPTERKDTEIHYPHRLPLVISPVAFNATQGKLAKASDWSIDIAMGTRTDRFDLTVAHGSPYVFGRISQGPVVFQTTNASLRTQIGNDERVLTLSSNGQTFAIFGPSGVRWEQAGEKWIAHLPQGKGYFSAAVLPDNRPETLALFTRHAYAFVTQTQVKWRFNESYSSVKTE